MKLSRLGLLAVPLALAATAALAQPSPPKDSNLSYGGMLEKKPKAPSAPDVPAPPSAWPRLDPGAVICSSEDDLRRRAALMRGEQVAAANCRPITRITAIQILHRAGLGATEVQLTGNSEVVWTDAWLPANPPPGTTPVSTR